MLLARLRGFVLPLTIAMLTTFLTVGTLSLLLQTPVREASRAKSVYVQ
ncbi:hypothetical protein [Leptolyngbya ohadii]|nr:hypothetical protein [Leptolyngbya ohadii]